MILMKLAGEGDEGGGGEGAACEGVGVEGYLGKEAYLKEGKGVRESQSEQVLYVEELRQ